MNNVRVESKDGRTEVFVNDVKLEKLRSIVFEQDFDTVPCFTFETVGLPNIVANGANVVCDFTHDTVLDAVYVLMNTLKSDIELYDAFRSSILSAIMEAPYSCSKCELAGRILDRMIGKE